MSELTERLKDAEVERLRAEVQSLKAGSGCALCDPTEVERLRVELAKVKPPKHYGFGNGGWYCACGKVFASSVDWQVHMATANQAEADAPVTLEPVRRCEPVIVDFAAHGHCEQCGEAVKLDWRASLGTLVRAETVNHVCKPKVQP